MILLFGQGVFIKQDVWGL